MAKRQEQAPPGMMGLVPAGGFPTGSAGGTGRAAPAGGTPAVASSPSVGRLVELREPLLNLDGVIDWRTIDPATIRGEGIPVEELLYYREKIEDLLRDAEGRYVLIVGRQVVSLFPDLDEAARYAAQWHPDRPVLIKKVVAAESVHSLGGAVIRPAIASGGARG